MTQTDTMMDRRSRPLAAATVGVGTAVGLIAVLPILGDWLTSLQFGDWGPATELTAFLVSAVALIVLSGAATAAYAGVSDPRWTDRVTLRVAGVAAIVALLVMVNDVMLGGSMVPVASAAGALAAALLASLGVLASRRESKPIGAIATVADATSPASVSASSSPMGGWAFVVFFLGWVGGLVGYLMLKDVDLPRAKNILKWGLIWTGIWVGLAIAVNVVVFVWLFAA